MWNVIVFRQTSANNTSAAGGSLNIVTPNGTVYVPDHLSKAGAKATTDYWDAHVLTPDDAGGDQGASAAAICSRTRSSSRGTSSGPGR